MWNGTVLLPTQHLHTCVLVALVPIALLKNLIKIVSVVGNIKCEISCTSTMKYVSTFIQFLKLTFNSSCIWYAVRYKVYKHENKSVELNLYVFKAGRKKQQQQVVPVTQLVELGARNVNDSIPRQYT